MENSYDYDFQTSDYQKIASYGGYQTYVTTGNVQELDEQGIIISYTAYEDEAKAEVWATYDPKDTTNTIDWADVSAVEVGSRLDKSIENSTRAADEFWVNDRVQMRYYEKFERSEGEFEDRRVGTLEREGNLETIFDVNWNVIGTQVGENAESVSLILALSGVEAEMLNEFQDQVLAYSPNFKTLQLIESDDGPSVLVNPGTVEIEAVVYYREELRNNGTERNLVVGMS